jgi:hypothetical protein
MHTKSPAPAADAGSPPGAIGSKASHSKPRSATPANTPSDTNHRDASDFNHTKPPTLAETKANWALARS